MRAGLLNKRCTILRPVRTTNAVGESVLSWERVRTIWASAWPTSASEGRTSAGASERVYFEVRMRRKAYRDLESDHRLIVEGRELEIVGITSVDNTEGELWRVVAIDTGL